MPAKSRTKTKKIVLQPGHCPICSHLIAEVVTSTGQVLHLDTTSPRTWVFSGRETPEGTPLVVPSRSYIEHREPCQGAVNS